MDWHSYDAALFDLDGVLTPTADVHMRAWQQLFTDFLAERGIDQPYVESDYFDYIDGKPRYDGVRSFLASRDIRLADGDPSDGPEVETVCGLGNRKNEFFAAVLREEGVQPYPGSVQLLDQLAARGTKVAVVSSSRNAPAVLDAADLIARFEVVVDGNVAAEKACGQAVTGHLRRRRRATRRAGRARGRLRGRGLRRRGRSGRRLRAGDRSRSRGRCRAAAESGADLVVADLAELVRHERAVRTSRSARADPLDRMRFPIDEWALVEAEYGTDDLGVTETLFAVGNGYLGMRGNVEEGRETHAHGTFINGFHETWPIRHAEEAFGFARVGQTIVNVPDNKTIKLYVDDEPMLLSVADLESYERTLDFRDGCCAGRSSGGRRAASGSRCRRPGWCRSPSGTWRS